MRSRTSKDYANLCAPLCTQADTVYEAPDGNETQLVSEQSVNGIDLLLTDIVMPNLSGRDLAELFRTKNPALKVLYMTGYSDDDPLHHQTPEPELLLFTSPSRPQNRHGPFVVFSRRNPNRQFLLSWENHPNSSFITFHGRYRRSRIPFTPFGRAISRREWIEIVLKFPGTIKIFAGFKKTERFLKNSLARQSLLVRMNPVEAISQRVQASALHHNPHFREELLRHIQRSEFPAG